MNNLLSANFARLKRDKIFWISCIFMFGYAVSVFLTVYIQQEQTGYKESIDYYYFNYILFIGFFVAVFCSMFLGSEYSDGTIRNKLMVGHKRKDIYLANLIVCIVGGLLMCLSFVIPATIEGILLLGFFETDISLILTYMLCSFVVSIAFAAISTLIAMLIFNKASSVVVNIVFFLILLIAASAIDSRLSEAPTQQIYNLTFDEEVDLNDLELPPDTPNPLYLSGAKREVYQWTLDILPTGQVIQIVSLKEPHTDRWLVSSILLIFLLSFTGIFIFEKKDIK